MMSPSVSLHAFGGDITALDGGAASDGERAAGVALVRDHVVTGRLRETLYRDGRLAVCTKMASNFLCRHAVRKQELRWFCLLVRQNDPLVLAFGTGHRTHAD